MRKPILLAALAGAGALAAPQAGRAQGNDQILFLGTQLGIGVGSYNGTGLISGGSLRFQQPLGANFSLTGRTGADFFVVKGKYKDYFRYYYGTTTGFSIPVVVGPRFYIVDGLRADLNLGVDIGVTSLAATSFHFEPGLGYTVPLANGNYVDLGSSFATSFESGSGAFLFNFAYGFNLGSRRGGLRGRAAPAPNYTPTPAPAPRPTPTRPRSAPRRSN